MPYGRFVLCQVANSDCTKCQNVNGLYFVAKMKTSCKLHMNGQWMKQYMLTKKIIHT